MSVKVKKRGRPSGNKPTLSAEKILEAAKSLMQKEGKIPSIRKLAVDLNVDAMAIYYYFESKSILLEAITVSLIEDIYQPQQIPTLNTWRQELLLLCQSYLKLLEQSPGLLETLLSMDSIGPATVFIQRFETIITPLNLPETERHNAISLLADYLHGYALALNTQKSKGPLTLSELEGPLELYCFALEMKKHE